MPAIYSVFWRSPRWGIAASEYPALDKFLFHDEGWNLMSSPYQVVTQVITAAGALRAQGRYGTRPSRPELAEPIIEDYSSYKQRKYNSLRGFCPPRL
jgi:hypothetical protein